MTDTNPLHTFAPHDLAGMFDVSVMTIRRWAEYHAQHLSAGANPPPGTSRRFTWADVETLRSIKAMRDNGLSVEAINVKLTESNSAVTVPVSHAIEQTAQEAHHNAPATLVALVEVERLIDAKLAALGKAREPSYFVGFGMGFIAALLFVLVIVGIALLYGGFR